MIPKTRKEVYEAFGIEYLSRTNSVICDKCNVSVFFIGDETPARYICPCCNTMRFVEGPEANYLVQWEINIYGATSHIDAARAALKIQRDPDSIWLTFGVSKEDENFERVDLYDD